MSSDVHSIDISGVRHLLTPGVVCQWSELDTRLVGSVQLVIGTEKTGLFPALLEKHGNLAVYETVLGSGLLLGGTSPLIRCEGLELSDDVYTLQVVICKV